MYIYNRKSVYVYIIEIHISTFFLRAGHPTTPSDPIQPPDQNKELCRAGLLMFSCAFITMGGVPEKSTF